MVDKYYKHYCENQVSKMKVGDVINIATDVFERAYPATPELTNARAFLNGRKEEDRRNWMLARKMSQYVITKVG